MVQASQQETVSKLYDSISQAMKDAMKARDKQRLSVIRMVLAALKQKQIDEKIDLDDGQVLIVLDKMVKQRRESCRQYASAGREDLATQEQSEIDVIQTFLPKPLTNEELDNMISEAMAATGAKTMQDMGKVMGILRGQLQGRADMAVVSNKIKAQLIA